MTDCALERWREAGSREGEAVRDRLAAQVETVFKGETLRGLLLNAYAFGTMATIALIAAIAAFVGAGLMLVLAGLGMLHIRKTRVANLS